MGAVLFFLSLQPLEISKQTDKVSPWDQPHSPLSPSTMWPDQAHWLHTHQEQTRKTCPAPQPKTAHRLSRSYRHSLGDTMRTLLLPQDFVHKRFAKMKWCKTISCKKVTWFFPSWSMRVDHSMNPNINALLIPKNYVQTKGLGSGRGRSKSRSGSGSHFPSTRWAVNKAH